MSQRRNKRFLAFLGLCIGACVQLTSGVAGLADDSQEKVEFETSDDASLLQISTSDALLQIPLRTVSGSQVPMTTLGHSIMNSAINEFREEEAGLCMPSPEQAQANKRGLKSFSAPLHGCFRFWHCLGNAAMFVGPISLAAASILFVLAVLVYVYEPFKPIDPPPPHDVSTPPIQTAPPQGKSVPCALRWLVLLFVTMINVNFTVMMPASSSVTEQKGGSVALSGFLIGSYAIGTALSIPLQIKLSTISYKAGFLVSALAGLVGNIVWAYATTLTTGVGALIFARIVCGFEGGIALMLTNIQIACTTGLSRIQFLAEINAAACVGLLLGPSMASLSFQLVGDDKGTFATACFMTCVAVVAGIAALIFCPIRESVIKFSSEKSFSADPVPDRTAYVGIAILSVSMFVRAFQRVFWEAAFLYIVSEGYKLGLVWSGYLTAVPICLLLFMPIIGRPLCQYLGVLGYIKANESLQLAGICLMFRVGNVSTLSLIMFMFGSAIFYFANWSQMLPLASFQARFALPHHPVLNMESIPAISWGASFVGYGLGPIASRMLVQACPHQNILPTALLISCGIFVIGQHIGLHVVKPFIPK